MFDSKQIQPIFLILSTPEINAKFKKSCIYVSLILIFDVEHTEWVGI